MLPEQATGADSEEPSSNMLAAGCHTLAPACLELQTFTVVKHIQILTTKTSHS